MYIIRKLPVINKYVQIPGAEIKGKNSILASDVDSLITGIQEKTIAGQQFIQFQQIGIRDNYPQDWFKILRDNI